MLKFSTGLREATIRLASGVADSSPADASDNERRPERGLGVNVGVGSPLEPRLSGVRERGRRLRVAGRGLTGVGLVTATTGEGVTAGRPSTDVVGEGRESCGSFLPRGSESSSSSSSSSINVPNWSFEEPEAERSLKESRLLPIIEFPKPVGKPPERVGFVADRSNIIFSMFGVESSGISTLLKETSCFPSRAHRARRRIESLSPKLTLSSREADGKSGRETPINSADSRRVDTEDLRRW